MRDYSKIKKNILKFIYFLRFSHKIFLLFYLFLEITKKYIKKGNSRFILFWGKYETIRHDSIIFGNTYHIHNSSIHGFIIYLISGFPEITGRISYFSIIIYELLIELTE